MGNSESSNPVRNMDKRTARREYRSDFNKAICNYRSLHVSNTKAIRHGIISASDDWRDGNIKVFVRKRPIFKHELDAFEFDVATCTDDHTIVIHDARMHNDMKRQLINHHEFHFDRTFNEHTKNDEVYSATAKSLVNIACDGGYSTCLVYGQTGSGKTFTMSSIYEHAAYDIFGQLEQVVERFQVAPTVTMSFVEIAGDYCHDLLNKFTPAQLLTGSDGSVHAFPVTEPTVSCAEELIAMIQHGMGVRTTAATGVHDQSSRSHAILRVYIQRHDKKAIEVTTAGGYSKAAVVEGVLTLVDLAGSEHRIDSMYHGKERRKETGNINASLMALKDCIRARAAGKILGFQYRRSKLTMALKCSFTLPTARTIVIATVSPASKDTEHSLNTLRHACIMHGQQDNSKPGDRETRFVTGGTVVTEQIGEINLTEIGRKNAQIKRSGGAMEGPKTNNGNVITDSKAAKAANNEIEITDKERLRLRKAAETRSIAKLLPQYRDMLKHFRGLLGQNRQQASRLQRLPTDPNAVVAEEVAAEEVVEEGVQDESPLGPHSPGNYYSDDDGQGGQDGQGQVEDDVQDFHSSLNKNKNNRLDLHEIATGGSRRGGAGAGAGSDNESVEDEVQGYFERNCYDRQPGRTTNNSSNKKKTSPAGKAAVLKRLNTPPQQHHQQQQQQQRASYYDEDQGEVEDDGQEVEDEEVDEEEEEWEEQQRMQAAEQAPAPRSRSSKSSSTSTSYSQQQQQQSSAGRPSSGRRGGAPSEQPLSSPPRPPSSSRGEKPSPGQRRLEFEKLYNTIYEGAEGVPEHILRRQLTSLLGLHGYSGAEIELMFEMHALVQENESMKRAVQEAKQNPAAVVAGVANGRSADSRAHPSQTRPQQASSRLTTSSQSVYEQATPPPQQQRRRSRQQDPPPCQDDEEVLAQQQAGMARAKVMNSPRGTAGHSPVQTVAVAESNVVSVKRSGSTRRGTTSTTSAAQQGGQQLPAILAQEQKQARLAEAKERREQEALAEAAVALEQQNALRKARQDAARSLREQQDEERRRKAAQLKPQPKKAVPTTETQAPRSSSGGSSLEDPIMTHSTAAASRNSIRKHEEEISSLMEQLQLDGNTEATNYALKKSIAVRKAALLRERRAAAQKSYLEDGYDEEPAAVPIKKSSRYGASFDVNLDAAVPVSQQQHQAERGGSSKSASRPKPVGFDNQNNHHQQQAGRSEYDDFSPGRAAPAGGRVQNSPPRAGGGGSNQFTRRAAPVRSPDLSDAFGGPRWAEDAPPEDPYYQHQQQEQEQDAYQQPANQHQQQQHHQHQQQQMRSRSSSNLPTQQPGGGGGFGGGGGGAPQFKSPQQLRLEQYHGYSPRADPQYPSSSFAPAAEMHQQQQEGATSRQPVRASPRAEAVPQRRRVVGAAAAPFGNEYSYDEAP